MLNHAMCSRIAQRWAAAAAACLLAAMPLRAATALKTVCTVTINSADEKEAFQRHLPRDQYRVVELVQRGQADWLAAACRRGVRCDALIISGHFDDGSEFYTDRFDDREFLTLHELQQASCSDACGGLFTQLKEVYLFGCNTLKSDPRYVASAEIARDQMRGGHSVADAERYSVLLSERYGQSNRDRLRHVFKGVPVLYGFSSKAPLGQTAGPLLDRYFQGSPRGEVASGQVSQRLLGLFAPSSMIAVAGVSDGDPHIGLRRDVCGLADERPSAALKLAFVHELLQRDMGNTRAFLDHLERHMGQLGAAQRATPEVAAALAGIAADHATRDRYLAFARDADDAGVQMRLMALARTLGWLSAEQQQAEFLSMINRRMTHQRIGGNEVDLVCASELARDPALARRMPVRNSDTPEPVAHAAVLACLGNTAAHGHTVRALTGARDDDAAIAQIYLRHRPLADASELRAVTTGIAHMGLAAAQVRALQTLARQRVTDVPSLLELTGLFPQTRSLDVQRAIAGVLIRADTQRLSRAELARSLRLHRLKSHDGSDVIDALIRVLQAS